MKFFKKMYGTLAHTILLMLGLGGFVGPVQASFDSDFVHKYTELNLGNWGHRYYTFPNSNDKINAFNRSVNINIPIGKSYKVNANFSTQMNLRYGSNIWQWEDNSGVVSAKPRSNFFNAGLGWNLGFGRLIEPSANPYELWMYETPAGKLIRFYDNFNGETPVANVFYSHDSQKLRLKVVSGTQMTVEFTNGHIHEFRKQEGNWEIYKRTDQFGNYQLFSYDYANNRVTTSDNHGRIQWIHFKADPSGYFPRVIDKLRLRRIGSGVSEHIFNYSTTTISVPGEDNDSATPASVTVPILTSITQPHGEQMIFAYYGDENVGRGRLKNYTNQFGGRVRYVYKNIDMPLVQNPANLSQTVNHFAADVVGASLRRAVDDVAGGILGDWTFSTTWHGNGGVRNAAPSLSQPTAMISAMDRPDGFTEEQYFRTLIQDINVTTPQVYTVDKSEYGYPGLVNDWKESLESTIKSAGIHKSKRGLPVYACTNCIDPNPHYANLIDANVGGYVKRRVFSGRNWAGQPGSIQHRNDWTTVRTVNLVQDIGKPGTSSLWITTPPTKITTIEGTYSKISEACYNSLGQITRKRQIRSTAQASNDFIQSHLYDASGNPIETKFYGGDSQAVTNGSLCSLSLPIPQYRKYTNWSKGSISGEGYLTATGAIANETNANTIDAQTGLTTSHHSGDGLWQSYGYDYNLRLTSSTLPAGMGGQAAVVFSPRSGAIYATKTTTLKTNDGLMTLGQTIKKYDSFGRVIETKKLGPAGWAVTSSTYDAMGNMSTATNERGGVSQYLNRDYKGRVGIRRPPEGSVHDVIYTYAGDKVSTRKISIAKDLTSNPPVEQFRTVTITNDIFGRTITETTSDQGDVATTRNTTYDLNNLWVTQTEGLTTVSNLDQYDAQGFLTVDSYGSSYTFNAMGQSLVKYSDYGDKIDHIYDEAGRLISKNVQGLNYVYYEYAAVNSPGEYNKGKLTLARRKNPNVEDFYRTITVIDTYEYKGRGGKVSKRTTSIDDLGGVGNIMSSSSSVVYNDRLQPLLFTSPSCNGTAAFSCPSDTLPRTDVYGYNLGHLVNVSRDGSPIMSNIQYNAAGDAISYQFANGTITELYYSTDIDEPNQAIVRKDGLLVWDSGVASADGEEIVHHHGVTLKIPDDFYEASTLQTQPTTYLTRPPNESLRVDPLGKVTSEIVTCQGNYPPCEDIHLYNADNEEVWFRHRPMSWPRSSTGTKLPSHVTLKDVLGRRGSDIIGTGNYTFDSHRTTTFYNTNYTSWTLVDVLLGRSKKSIAKYEFLPTTPTRYFHTDFTYSNLGESTNQGVFSPEESL